MINKSGKYFRKFTPSELFTEYIFDLMKQRKEFMVFTDNNQILIDDEMDEWNLVNGITNPTERLIYHCINDEYVISHTDSITNVMVPYGLFEISYEDYIKQCEEDVQWRIE